MASSFAAVAAVLLAGCVVTSHGGAVCGDGIVQPPEQCDDGANNGVTGDACSSTCTIVDEAHIGATWTFTTLATGQATGCPVGFDIAALHTQLVDMTGAPIGTCQAVSNTCFIERFPCASGAGTSAPVPPAMYVAWVDIEDTAGANVYATSISYRVDVTSVDQTIPVEILNDGGYFHFSWQLVGATSGAALTCAQANVTGTIESVATIAGTSTSFDDRHSCSAGDGYTRGVAAASYSLQIAATNSAGQPLGTPATVTGAMGMHNDLVELGVVRLPITGL